jgi:glycosyltransferase involved in cell wall biosynthesis
MGLSFSAAIFTGGPIRLDITCKSIESLNNQTYDDVQKILVNGDGNSEKIDALKKFGADLSDWEIIDFPIDTYDRNDINSLHRWPGRAALKVSKGDFFFTMNDDDSVSTDFFYRMARLLQKHPEAVTGIGLPVSFIHETGEIIKRRPRHADWRTRPEVEPGIDCFRKIYREYGDPFYNPNPGFQFVCKTDYVRDVQETFFSDGAFPDVSFQSVLIRGETVFDPEALMLWGRHEGQVHNDMEQDHFFNGAYFHTYKLALKVNDAVFDRFLPNSGQDKKLFRTYYNSYLAETSIDFLLDFIGFGRFIRGQKNTTWKFKSVANGRKFPFGLHLRFLISHPIISSKLLFLKGKTALMIIFAEPPIFQKWS